MNDKSLDIRWEQRFENFENAYKDFSEACSLSSYSKLERSGLIQTFEFTFELAWKTLQDLLSSRGYVGINGPRPVLEKAFQDALITQGEEWLKMMKSRKLTVHTYHEKTAEIIAHDIKTKYYPLLTQLIQRLGQERAK